MESWSSLPHFFSRINHQATAGRDSRDGRYRRSADFQSAVSRICLGGPYRVREESLDALPITNRRYGELKICYAFGQPTCCALIRRFARHPASGQRRSEESFLQTPSSQPRRNLVEHVSCSGQTRQSRDQGDDDSSGIAPFAKRFARALGAHFAKCGSLLPNGCGVRACPRLSRQVFHRELPRLAIRRPRELARFRVAKIFSVLGSNFTERPSL